MDKLEKEKYISIEDTEQLCRLYLECKLSRLEEAELQYVLGIIPYDTPVITEVRTLMDLTLSCAIEKKASSFAEVDRNRKNMKKRLLQISASVALILSAGIPIYLHYNRQDDFYCQVYSHGKEISRDKAIIIAEDQLERIDSFLEHIKSIEEEQQHKIDSL